METINAVWEHSYGEDCIPNFSANMEQPRHRWYEFKEGFSLTLVERAIRETKKDNKSTSFTVLDPFSGSGTSPLTALQSRCNAIGYEVNPFMSFVGKTKCQQRTKSIHDYTKELNRILVQRPFRLKSPLEGVSTFTGSGENGKWLFNLDVLRAYEALYQHISLSEYKDFFLLALITSAMQCCNAKKDGKCLRYLKNWKALNYTGANLRDTFKANALQMISDLERSPLLEGTRDITQGDTRKLLQASEHDSADLIIFSPPYLNSFDYRDARANEGAKQLIDYLASSVQEEPDKHFVGYLTVFDGRRGKTSNQYERQEINYRSEYSSHPSMNYRRFYMAECV